MKKKKNLAIKGLAEFDEWRKAQGEAVHLELGKDNKLIHSLIEQRLIDVRDWVLIGGLLVLRTGCWQRGPYRLSRWVCFPVDL
jgi:hypothetical protein